MVEHVSTVPVPPVGWRNVTCPYLAVRVRGVRVIVDGSVRAADLARPGVDSRCGARPGVSLMSDYVIDVCSGRYYPASTCSFYGRRDDP
jgi:hypothetical protein